MWRMLAGVMVAIGVAVLYRDGETAPVALQVT